MMADEIDYYALLEVHPTASQEMISRAYRLHASRRHPDVQPEGERAAAEEFMRVLNAAYSVLSDPTRRAEYDRTNGRPALAAEGRDPVQRAERRGADVANTALCANHPGRPRATACVGCRQSLCQDCLVDVAGMPYCRECVPHAPRGAAPKLAPHVAPPTGPIARLARMKLPSVDLAGVSGLIAVLAILALMAGAVLAGIHWSDKLLGRMSGDDGQPAVTTNVPAVSPGPPSMKVGARPSNMLTGRGTPPQLPSGLANSAQPGPAPQSPPPSSVVGKSGVLNRSINAFSNLNDVSSKDDYDAAVKFIDWQLHDAEPSPRPTLHALTIKALSWCVANHDRDRLMALQVMRPITNCEDLVAAIKAEVAKMDANLPSTNNEAGQPPDETPSKALPGPASEANN